MMHGRARNRRVNRRSGSAKAAKSDSQAHRRWSTTQAIYRALKARDGHAQILTSSTCAVLIGNSRRLALAKFAVRLRTREFRRDKFEEGPTATRKPSDERRDLFQRLRALPSNPFSITTRLTCRSPQQKSNPPGPAQAEQ